MQNDEEDDQAANDEVMADPMEGQWRRNRFHRILERHHREEHPNVWDRNENNEVVNGNDGANNGDGNVDDLGEDEMDIENPLQRAGRRVRLLRRGLWRRQRTRRARMDIHRNDPNLNQERIHHRAFIPPLMMREERDEDRVGNDPALAAAPRERINPINRMIEIEEQMERNLNRFENENNDDDDFDFVLNFGLGNLENRIAARRAATEGLSSGLFDMVREGRMCKSVLSGWGRSEQCSCDSIVQHCASHPEDAHFVHVSGRTPLHEACLRGACRHVIKALLCATDYRGAKERDQHGNTPLHLLFVDYSSTSLNNSNLVWSPEDLALVVGDLLCQNPSYIASCSNANGDTPLHSACMAPETMVDPSSIVQLLKANPRAATRLNGKYETPLRVHCQRRNASPEVAKLLLETNRDALTVRDINLGWAPIHAAAANANFKLLRYLVESCPDSVRVQTSQRQTALHLLCQHHTHLSTVGPPPSVQSHNQENSDNDRSRGSNVNDTPNVEAAVEFLLLADPEAIMGSDSINGYTPLHLVCKTEGSRQVPLQVVRLLLGCNPRAAGVPDSQHYLPLHHACKMGANTEVIRALVEAYPDATSALTRRHDSALSLACTSNNSAETIQLLIKANPKVLTQKNDYGFCPLHCVCRAHQPRMGIVKALVDACPESVHLKTNSGETPVQLASSNTGAFVGVLQLLSQTQELVYSSAVRHAEQAKEKDILVNSNVSGETNASQEDTDTENGFRHPLLLDHSSFDHNDVNRRGPSIVQRIVTTTRLHDACFRGTPYEQIEQIAKANPEYILVCDSAGYTPLQILCKRGRIDERIISTFAQMGGPDIFAVKDTNGNTPLHSVMRNDVDVASLRCLIRASPDALRCRNAYGDLPLHLACLRRCSAEVIQEVAIAASSGDLSLAVVPNLAGQTPIGIAMGEFRDICSSRGTCTVSVAYRPDQRRIFHVLSTLVKIVHYGPLRCQQHGTKDLSLLKACVVLHRQNIRLDPAFIQQVIHVYPEEVKLIDEDGNYPLHIEASIPIEKMSLLDGVCRGASHRRMGILRILLEAYPSACSIRNKENHFPLGLMIQAGRVWGHTIAVALKAFPPALHWYKGLDDRYSAILLEKASKECGSDTLFALLVSRPGLFDATSHRRGALQKKPQP